MKKKALLISVLWFLLILYSCSEYIPEYSTLSKLSRTEDYLTHFQIHNTTKEKFLTTGFFQDSDFNFYSFIFSITKLKIEDSNYYVIDLFIIDYSRKLKFFSEDTSIDPTNTVELNKNIIKIGNHYIKWDKNSVYINYNKQKYKFNATINLSNYKRNFYNTTINDNIYIFSRSLNSKINLTIEDKFKVLSLENSNNQTSTDNKYKQVIYKLNGSFQGYSFITKEYGNKLQNYLETFFIRFPMDRADNNKNKSIFSSKDYIIFNMPRKNILKTFKFINDNLTIVKSTSYSYQKLIKEKNRRFGVEWEFQLDQNFYKFVPFFYNAYISFFERDIWNGLFAILNQAGFLKGFGIALIDEYSRIKYNEKYE